MTTTLNGSVEFMPQNILTARMKELKDELLELMEEQKRRDAFTSTERLADRLHALLHRMVDCDYNYSKWPHAAGCRAQFWLMAAQLEMHVIGTELEEALKIMEANR